MKILRSVASVLILSLLLAGAAAAAGPAWMPNFPMRMGAAGVMGMWMPVPGATEYKVLRQVGGGAWEEIYKGPMNNFQDPAAPADKDVAYKVVAIIGGAEGEASAPVTLAGQKALEPPKEIRFRLEVANQAVGLGWNASDGGSFYNVYRAEKAGEAGSLLGSVQDLKYTDATVKDGNTYWYAVAAVGTTGQESPRGEPVKVEVKFPKAAVVKKFELKTVPMTFVKMTQGEDWAEFSNPSDLVFHEGLVYVACQDGIQVVDAEGSYVNRLPLVQEKVASREWNRPFVMGVSPAGNLAVVHQSENVLRELTPDGTSLVRELRLPALPGNPRPGMMQGLAYAPDGSAWAIDANYGNLALLPADSGDAPSNDAITRYGYVRVTGNTYNAETDGDQYIGAAKLRYARPWNLVLVLEATMGRLSGVEPATGKKLFSVVGIGGGLHEASLISDFVVYDDQSVLIADALKGEVKRIKIAPGDASNGDYLEHFVDDPEGKVLKLQSLEGSATKLSFDRAAKRLYVLATQTGEVGIFDLP